ncbi:hypothetical protein [Neoasaia chiangmaiensis]|nr:hypothetical protein [Neoasaia chiangmaiensis]
MIRMMADCAHKPFAPPPFPPMDEPPPKPAPDRDEDEPFEPDEGPAQTH